MPARPVLLHKTMTRYFVTAESLNICVGPMGRPAVSKERDPSLGKEDPDEDAADYDEYETRRTRGGSSLHAPGEI